MSPTRSPMVRPFGIGRLASLTDCAVATIRYYEEIGLLPKARRHESGHRMYDDASVAALSFIRRCRDLGFPLDDIKALIAISGSEARDCSETRQLAQSHLDTVRARMTELQQLEQALTRFVASCSETCHGGPASGCTIPQDIRQWRATPPAAAPVDKPAPGRCCS